MWKKMRNSKIYMITLCTFIFIIGFAQISKAGYFEPGSKDDPVVTQSYVEKRNEQLKYYIDQKTDELAKQIQNGQGGGQGPVFEIIELQKGQKIICGASTELIIRSGGAKAIASQAGGLANLISGVDLSTGQNVTPNQLILSPRNDGRGIEITENRTFILIKGSYSIQ
ncbi:MAG: hypothetical protein ACOYVK_20105 [Bacillota bacterium]